MKTLLTVLIGINLSLVAQAQEFICADRNGDPLLITQLEGVYLGEQSDAVVLNTNSDYNVYEKNKPNYNGFITLGRLAHDKKLERGGFADFPIQFSVTEKDDLGSWTTVFAIPLGVFGAERGYRFEARLKTSRTYQLKCRLR